MRFSIYFMSPSQVKDQVKDKSIINYCSPMDLRLYGSKDSYSLMDQLFVVGVVISNGKGA